MSYLTFLLVFLVPPIVFLAIVQPRPMGNVGAKEMWKWILILCAIAFTYTTPWDNYLVYRGVWKYGQDRVIGTIGYVPIEEYLFFMLQPILTGLWVSWLLGRHAQTLGPPARLSTAGRFAYMGLWLLLTIAGIIMIKNSHSLYLGLILAWASPVLAGMAWLSAPLFWNQRRVWVFGVGIPTLYLWLADRLAIGMGIWDISDAYSFGFDPLGLPIEEAVFFLVTNLLVVQGLLMFIPERVFKLQ